MAEKPAAGKAGLSQAITVALTTGCRCVPGGVLRKTAAGTVYEA
jgi:hypothetical protein